MVKKLKILAASDIHGDSKITKKLALKAEKEKNQHRWQFKNGT